MEPFVKVVVNATVIITPTMRHHTKRIRSLLHIATLVTMAAVMMPVVMPICVMASDLAAESSLPCHPPPVDEKPCHATDDAPEPELDCCSTSLQGLHEEAVSAERADAHLLLILPFVVSLPDADPDEALLSISATDAPAPRAPVGLSILFRSLLN